MQTTCSCLHDWGANRREDIMKKEPFTICDTLHSINEYQHVDLKLKYCSSKPTVHIKGCDRNILM